MWSLARRPRWIGALLLALLLAAGFAALSQWQLSRSVASGVVLERDTETISPLSRVTSPQAEMTAPLDGQRVSTSGTFVSGDYSIVDQRFNGGVQGAWVVGHLQTEPDGAALAVALGWAKNAGEAASVIANLDALPAAGRVDITGRYLAGGSPEENDFENGAVTEIATSALVNEWAGVERGAFAGYLVMDAAPAGLAAIDSPAPEPERTLNWLNIFYAVEWVVFAGFALYMWYRLVKDAWERELEEAADAAAAAAAQLTPVN